MKAIELETIIKNKMGDDFPKDLVFKNGRGQISFYIKSNPVGESIFNTQWGVSKEDIELIIMRIRQLYVKWKPYE